MVGGFDLSFYMPLHEATMSSHRRRSTVFRVLFQQTNKQTKPHVHMPRFDPTFSFAPGRLLFVQFEFFHC